MEWIKIEDEKPKNTHNICVKNENGYLTSCEFTDGRFYVEELGGHCYDVDDVVYWLKEN